MSADDGSWNPSHGTGPATAGAAGSSVVPVRLCTTLHPAWRSFVLFCQQMRFGEIENLKIQDGLPVLAELTRKKVKF